MSNKDDEDEDSDEIEFYVRTITVITTCPFGGVRGRLNRVLTTGLWYLAIQT